MKVWISVYVHLKTGFKIWIILLTVNASRCIKFCTFVTHCLSITIWKCMLKQDNEWDDTRCLDISHGEAWRCVNHSKHLSNYNMLSHDCLWNCGSGLATADHRKRPVNLITNDLQDGALVGLIVPRVRWHSPLSLIHSQI